MTISNFEKAIAAAEAASGAVTALLTYAREDCGEDHRAPFGDDAAIEQLCDALALAIQIRDPWLKDENITQLLGALGRFVEGEAE